MAKKKSGRRGPQKRRQTKHLHPVRSAPADESGEAQPLIQQLRRALRSDHPMDFLYSVSQLMTVTDPRTRDPFEPEDQSQTTLESLVESFVGVDYAETTAALHVLRAFTSDELLAARIGRELKTRRQPMPPWLAGIDSVAVERTLAMTHVLGDGDDYFVDVRFQSGEAMTALVYVDHNLGTIVKDAFVIPEPFEAVEKVFHERIADPDTTIVDADPARVRATVEQAIALGARTYPQPSTESWPGCRPLVEWLLRLLPAGGAVQARPKWSEDQLAGLRQEFLASAYAKGMRGQDQRGLLEDFTWFGSGYGPGDPTRWSPVNVEMLLVDWIPRKIVADVAYLAEAPAVLRRFVEFCHARQGIRRELTLEVLAAVDRWEPEYQRLIRSSRPQGAHALASAVLDHAQEYDDGSLADFMMAHLEEVVGGQAALMNLDTHRLPDEPFEWAGIPDDIRNRVGEVLELCDSCADELFDIEHRTAFRRFLSRAAVGDPMIFRRKGAAGRAAAAVCWAVGRANHTVAGPQSRLESQELLRWFGITKGSVGQRAEVFLKAIGVDAHRKAYGDLVLGSTDYLVSRRRAAVVEQRDKYLEVE